MSAAVATLKRELQDQEEKLRAIEEEHKPAIEAGRRAQSVVDGQKRHVEELRSGIRVLEDSAKEREREVPL